jgi:hypothetical protein
MSPTCKIKIVNPLKCGEDLMKESDKSEFRSYYIWSSHSGHYEEFCLLGYRHVESQLTFRRNISPPSSGSNSKPSKEPLWSRQLAKPNPECQLSPDYIALYPRNIILYPSCFNVKLKILLSSFTLYVGVKHPIWGPRPDFYYCQTFAGLLMWGAFSD